PITYLNSFPTRRSSDLVAISKDGVSKIGGAQESSVMVTGHINKKSTAKLINPNTPYYLSEANDKISVPNRNSIVKLLLTYTCTRSEEHTSELQSRENLV